MAIQKFSSVRTIAALIAAVTLITVAAVPARAQTPPPPPHHLNNDWTLPGNFHPPPGTMSVGGTYPVRTPELNAAGEMIIDLYVIRFPNPLHPCSNGSLDNTQYTYTLGRWLNEASRWQGGASASISMTLRGFGIWCTSVPQLPNGNADIGAIISDTHYAQRLLGLPGPYPGFDICNEIAASTRPVHVWIWGDERSKFPEVAINGDLHDAHGFYHNMPRCGGKQYVVFGFSDAYTYPSGSSNWYQMPLDNALHNYGHYWEYQLQNAHRFGFPAIMCNSVNSAGAMAGGNPAQQIHLPTADWGTGLAQRPECAAAGVTFPRNNFMTRGSHETFWAINGCGDVHYPPTQGTLNDHLPGNEYIYNTTTTYGTRCNSWWVQSGPWENVNCTLWGCIESGYLRWWMQRIPGRGSGGNAVSAATWNWWGLWWIGQ